MPAGPLPFLHPASAAGGTAGYVQTSGEAGRTMLGSKGQMPEAVVSRASASAQAVLPGAAACTKEDGVGLAWQGSSWLLPCSPFPVLCFSGPVAGRLC